MNVCNKMEAIPKLYQNCILLYDDIYAYAPVNELDADLFEACTHMPILQQKDNIRIKDRIQCPVFCDYRLSVGNIDSKEHPKCSLCKLYIPADFEYYTRDDNESVNTPVSVDSSEYGKKYVNAYNVCHLCYENTTEPLVKTKIDSGLDNARDWVHIFTYISESRDPDFSGKYYYDYYCNLNRNSPYYSRFAVDYYVDMLGEEFEIIEDTTVDEIIQRHENK
jgi:hypothetical protein